jgi:fumarate hydratase subunit beta
MKYQLQLPLSQEAVSRLRIGDEVILSGSLLVGRDQVHKRIVQSLIDHGTSPVDLVGQTIYYMGPAPAPKGQIIGSCGPTTASRMDPFVPDLLRAGLTGMIGKGPRSTEVAEAIRSARAVYFAAYGGCGALYAQCVQRIELLAFEDLGPEALFRIHVRDFPVITAIDPLGDQIYTV